MTNYAISMLPGFIKYFQRPCIRGAEILESFTVLDEDVMFEYIKEGRFDLWHLYKLLIRTYEIHADRLLQLFHYDMVKITKQVYRCLEEKFLSESPIPPFKEIFTLDMVRYVSEDILTG